MRICIQLTLMKLNRSWKSLYQLAKDFRDPYDFGFHKSGTYV